MPKFSPPPPSQPRVYTANPDGRIPASNGEDVREAELLTVKEAADLLRCSKSYLDKLRCAGGGPEFVRLGVRKILYRRVDLLNWAKARRFDSTSRVAADRRLMPARRLPSALSVRWACGSRRISSGTRQPRPFSSSDKATTSSCAAFSGTAMSRRR